MMRKTLPLIAMLVPFLASGHVFQAGSCQPALRAFVQYAAAGYFDPFFANGPWLNYTEPWY